MTYGGALSGLEDVVGEMERVRDLAVSAVKSGPTMQQFWECFTRPAPKLESFVVFDPQTQRSPAGPVTRVPPVLFRGETPSLQRLELRQCTWCWASTLFCSTVTSLILDGRKIWIRPRVEEILVALERMPMLEVAVLDQITPDIPWDFYPTSGKGRVVHLAHLKYLFIDGLALNCATLLYQIELPSHTRLCIYCQPFSRYKEFYAVACAIRTKYQGLSDASENLLRSFTFVPLTAEGLRLRAWTTIIPVEELRNRPATDASLEMRLAWNGASPSNSVESLRFACKALPLHTVRTFYVPGYFSLDSAEWVEIFESMQSLEELWVYGQTANHLPSALRKKVLCSCGTHLVQEDIDEADHSSDEEDEEAQPTYSFLFPALRVLKLEGVDFAGDERSKEEIQIYVYRCRNFILEQSVDLELMGAKVHWNGQELLDFDLSEIDSDASAEDYEDYYDDDEDVSEDDDDDDSSVD
ncbi:hypothetical protein SCP_0203310 [Sparassis crispa]|uniref:F-box domain-containing protein n=1 Tax=Sparassis crispa TaxID=139825 RepID=A0A401GAC6_9APHY|nr:hypothetical protein SCP_0203310 [Sparassis crispa]GBE79134.1 hypothetical protein SCP_0203310 [Sparassis crispa]